MKKNLLRSCAALFIFSIICLSSPAVASAGSPQDDQSATASLLQLTATGPQTFGQIGDVEKTGDFHSINIALKKDINAFFDFAPTNDQDITKKRNGMDFRPVVGFRITLK